MYLSRVFRFTQFCFLLVALFSGQAIQAQTRQTLSFSVQAYDKLFSQLAPGQEDVLIGDMRFKVEKLTAWRNHLDDRLNNRPVLQGAFDFSSTTPWPAGVVPYLYDSSVPEATKTLFESAIREWQINSSLNFVLRTSEPNYLLIKFTGNESGALMNSWIGVRGRSQDLNVAGWGNKIDCAHELGHALGMTHEQCRSDRDAFVTITATNMTVNPSSDVNYAIVPASTSTNRTAYDYDSLMHYPRDAFPMTKSGKVSLLVKSPNQRWSDGLAPEEIGQKTHLSVGDKAAMAGQYGAPLRISGRIVDAANSPLAGVQVTLSGGSIYRGANPASTDANGNYEFNGIPRNSGTYTLNPSQPGTSFTQASRTATVTAGSQTTVDFISIDSAPPNLIITIPAISGVYSTLSTATGAASDAVGLREVRVALARTSDLVWWNFRDGVWGSTTFDWATSVRIATGTSIWSANLPTLPVGGYQVHVQSVDVSDNASPWRFRHFFLDAEPPVVAVTEPANNTFISEFTILRGTASDGAGTGLSNGIVHFTLYQNGDFWTGFNWKPNTTAQDPDVLLFADVVGGVWIYNNVPARDSERAGTYYVSLFARDNAGNTSAPVSGVTSVQFSVDKDPPSISITSPATGSRTSSNLTAITGTMDDSRGVVSVRVYLLRYGDNAFWDGTAWAGGGSAILPVSINANNGTWTTTGPLPSVNTMNPANRLSNGGYDIIAFAVDAAGNQRRIDSVVTVEYYPQVTYTRGSFSDPNPANHNDLWDNPANWSPASVPGDQELAIVDNNLSPQFTGTRTVRRLEFRSGTIRGGTLVIPAQGRMEWSGGTLEANLVVNEGGELNLSGNATLVASTTLNNNGTTLWSGAGNLLGGYATVFNNNGTFIAQNDSVLYNYTGGSPLPTFNNYGTFQKAATNVTGISAANGGWIFNHFGTLDIQDGVVSFQGQANIQNGSVFSGAGVTRIDSGTTTVYGTNNLAGGNVELAGGILNGTNLFTGPGIFHWSGGTIIGSPTVSAGANLLIKGDASKALNGSLSNAGAGVWTGSGDVNCQYNSVFHNRGAFTALNNAQFYNYTGGTPVPVFINTGTFKKTTGTSTTVFAQPNGGVAFYNLGAVDVQSGVLALGGGGTNSNGNFNTASGARVDIIGGTHTWMGGMTCSGSGRTRMTGGAIIFGGGNNTINSGATFEVSSGTLDGTCGLTGSGTFNWTGGNIAATLDLGPNLTFSISGESNKALDGTINNAGTAIWTGAGPILGHWGSALINTGTFNIRNDSQFYNYTGGSPVPIFNNAGTVRKTVATGLTVVSPANGGWMFNNSGVLDIQTGVLSSQTQFNLNDGGSFSGAGLTRVDGATTTMNGSHNIVAGGTFELANGTLNGAGNFHGPGTFVWSGGAITGINGVGTNGNMVITGSNSKTLNGVFSNAGTALWSGPGTMNCSAGSIFDNSGTFMAQNSAQAYNYTGGNPPPAFNNSGTFIKNGDTNRTEFMLPNGGVSFNNTGTVIAETGVLAFGGGGTSSNATFTASSGARIEFPSGAHYFKGRWSFNGIGLTRVNGAGVTFLGGTHTVTTGGVFELAAGTLDGLADFAGPGAFNWTGGNIAATLDLQPNLTFSISGNDNKTLDGTINNAGTAIWTGTGPILGHWGSALINTGTFNIQNDSQFYNYTGGSPVPIFNNAGTVRKTVATGPTVVSPANGGWIFNNSGLLDIQSGVLSSQTQFNLNAGGSFSGAGVTRNDGGAVTMNGTSSVLSGGTFELASGTLDGTGTFNGPGTFIWSSGSLNGTIGVGATANLLLSGDTGRSLIGTLNNAGTATWIGNGTLNFSHDSILNNSGTFIAQNDAQFYNFTGGNPAPVFNNTGTLRKTTSTGTTTFSSANGGVSLANPGTVDLQSGTLSINASYSSSAASRFKVSISGATPATQFGREVFSNDAPLQGTLQVVLLNGFIPTNGSSFDLVGYATHSGQFTSTQLPPLLPGSVWKIEYNSAAITLRVVPADVSSAPRLLPNGHFQMSFNGLAANAAIFQGSTNLVNWIPLLTNSPFNGTFLFDDARAMNFTNRFYQILIVQ